MTKPLPYIRNNRPAVFDWMVFLCTVSLGFIFPSLGEFINTTTFSYWMLFATVLYTVGAWLKRMPLAYRMDQSPDKNKEIPFLFFLVLGHWVIFLIAGIFSDAAVRNIIGAAPQNPEHMETGVMILGSILLGTLISVLVYYPLKVKEKGGTKSPAFLFRRELVADIFLVASVAILSFVFWEKSIMALFFHVRPSSLGDVCFLFIFLSLAYLVFYLPLRYLFLIEDHFNKQTWQRLFFIFALILTKCLFEVATF